MNCPHCGNVVKIEKSLLSNRELEIVNQLVTTTAKYNELYQKLGYTRVESLCNIAHSIYKKLGVHSRSQLVTLWEQG